ncbi:MAG TPA: NFACT RNA binding domain-containing protein [Cyclobacteriaceae bacterium]|nr:NFACT RNA binding domain-containing protein [Cyclobacteriaceae bacterium]
MHNNYYFLRRLSAALDLRLANARLLECFTQNRDELVLAFLSDEGEFFMRAYLGPDFSCLSFPKNFHRARKNTVGLFPPLIGLRCNGVHQHLNERSFRLVFESGVELLFRMHGTRANVLLLHDGIIADTFRKQVKSNLDNLDRTIDWSYAHFVQNRDRLKETYFTLGKVVWTYLESEGFSACDPEAQWKRLVALVEEMEGGPFYIVNYKGTPTFSLMRFGTVTAEFTDPIEAVDTFYRRYTQALALTRARKQLLSSLRQQHKKTTAWLATHRARLSELKSENKYRVWADLIMAHLGNIPPGETTVSLPAFDGEAKVEIKLKPGRSPQQNAEVYYTKAKNAELEITHLERMIKEREDQLETIQAALRQVEEALTLDDLRKLDIGSFASERRNEASLPYREYEHMGFRILVGRNAEANDKLLQRFTAKDDLWLHARDVSGSHVIVKFQSGKAFPKPVIERAAQLAAFHSKRRNESLCPVICVPRKFVRKRKGDPPGAVRVEREEVILATPTP